MSRATRPLWLRFAIRLSGALIIMVLVMVVLFVSFYRYSHIREAKEYIQTFSQTLSKQVQPALLTYNQSQMEGMTEFLDLQQHIILLAIYDAEGERIVSKVTLELADSSQTAFIPRQQASLPVIGHFQQTTLKAGRGPIPALIYQSPIHIGDDPVIWGSLVVGYSLQSDLPSVGQFLQLFGLLALFGIGIGFFVVRFFRTWITSPIDRLQNATRQISKGNYLLDIPVRGAHELADLARSFNLMSAEISSSHEQLQKQADLLEETVELRTAELAESKVFNERLVAGLPDTVAIHQDGVLKFVNAAGIKLLGYNSADEIIGRPALDFVHLRFHETIRERVRRVREEGLRVPLTDEVFVRKDGTEIIVEVAAAPIQFEGKPAVVVSLRDITEIRKLQQQAARAERLETVGNIAAQVAHDFNNLLTPIVAFPDMIRAHLENDHPAIRYIEDIKRHGERIAEINQQLLTLGRRGHYNLEPLDLNLVIHEVTRFLSIPKQIKLELDLAENLFQISGGESQLARVFSNLILNGIDSIQTRGWIKITTCNVYLDEPLIGYERIDRGEYAVVSVQDNGPGISEANLSRIFDPFFTTKTAGKVNGSGLGLSVVQNVIRDHQGYLDIRTGRTGTTFMLYFPATRHAELSRFQKDTDFKGHERLLVVDDDVLQFNVLDELLSTMGYHLFYAESPEKAIAMCKRHSYDLVILDMVLDSELDGVDVFFQIRKFKPTIKAIIISGFAESHRMKTGLEGGIGAFVRKPLTLDKISAAVRTELDRVESSGEL